MGWQKQKYVPYEYARFSVRLTEKTEPFLLKGLSSVGGMTAEPIPFKDAEDLKRRVAKSGRKLFYVCCKHRKRIRFTWETDSYGILVYGKSANAVREYICGDDVAHGSAPGKQIGCLLNIQELSEEELSEVLNIALRKEYGENIFHENGILSKGGCNDD